MSVVQMQRVRPGSPFDRRVLGLAVVVLVALGGFWVGRQSAGPTPPARSTPAGSVAPSVTLERSAAPATLTTPLVRPAIIPADLEAAATKVLGQGLWAACVAASTIRCEPLPTIELTATEAAEARTAWSRTLPVALSPGDVVIAAPAAKMDYALFVSMDPKTRPTLLDPAVAAWGTAFLDLGPYLPPGRYVIMVAHAPSQPGFDSFEAAGVVIGQ
jgi:hypothetical protein